MATRFYTFDSINATSVYEKPYQLHINHQMTTEFEETIDPMDFHRWVVDNFHRYVYLMVSSYLLIVFGLKRWMSNRKPLELRIPLIVWNTLLAIFSTIGACRTVPEVIAIWRAEGFEGTLCHRGHAYGVTGVWLVLFVFSKFPEFGDTIFIVLRKKPLIFLHWYHHVETAYYSMWSFSSPCFPVSRYFVALNYTVHSMMYAYFAARAAGARIPKPIAMGITVLQISQMFAGLFVLIAALRVDCYNHPPALYGGLFTYSVYAIMFMDFFYKSYLRRPSGCPSSGKSSLSLSPNGDDKNNNGQALETTIQNELCLQQAKKLL